MRSERRRARRWRRGGRRGRRDRVGADARRASRVRSARSVHRRRAREEPRARREHRDRAPRQACVRGGRRKAQLGERRSRDDVDAVSRGVDEQDDRRRDGDVARGRGQAGRRRADHEVPAVVRARERLRRIHRDDRGPPHAHVGISVRHDRDLRRAHEGRPKRLLRGLPAAAMGAARRHVGLLEHGLRARGRRRRGRGRRARRIVRAARARSRLRPRGHDDGDVRRGGRAKRRSRDRLRLVVERKRPRHRGAEHARVRDAPSVRRRPRDGDRLRALRGDDPRGRRHDALERIGPRADGAEGRHARLRVAVVRLRPHPPILAVSGSRVGVARRIAPRLPERDVDDPRSGLRRRRAHERARRLVRRPRRHRRHRALVLHQRSAHRPAAHDEAVTVDRLPRHVRRQPRDARRGCLDLARRRRHDARGRCPEREGLREQPRADSRRDDAVRDRYVGNA